MAVGQRIDMKVLELSCACSLGVAYNAQTV